MRPALLILCSFLLLHNAVISQDHYNAMLDTIFGMDGRVVTELSKDTTAYLNIKSVLVQKDGKIIIAANSSFKYFTIARYLQNGKLDLKFGRHGFIYSDYAVSEFLYDAKLQSNGKIIVAGRTYISSYSYFLARYNIDGSIDSSFGENGRYELPGNPYSIVIDKNDNIIVTSERGDRPVTFTLWKYNKNGKADSSFGNGGEASVSFGRLQLLDAYPKVVLDTANNIVIGSTAVIEGGLIDDFVIIRFKQDGKIDNSFNGVGWTSIDYEHDQNYLNAILIQKDNKIIAGGGDFQDFTIVRLNSNGGIDKNFGNEGFVITDFNFNHSYSTEDYVVSLLLQNDGKIIAAGNSLSNHTYRSEYAIARYTSKGFLDNSFGLYGHFTTIFGQGSDSRLGAAAIQPDEKIILAGTTRPNVKNYTYHFFATVRYNKELPTLKTFTITNTTKINKPNSFTLSPNPVKDKFVVSGFSSFAKISIVNSEGKILQKRTVNSPTCEFNVSALAAGMYVVSIAGNEKTSLKFVKE